MATVFKTFLNDDMASTRTLLHEAIPVSGGILFGTYPEPGTDLSNIKTYTHGMFQSVYDYSYTKSSANHIFDITVGYSSATTLTIADTNAHKTSKEMIYNEFAKILMGHDDSGNINRLDFDGDLLTTLTDKIDECYVISVARLLNKDEIKKGSFYMDLDVSNTMPTSGSCAIGGRDGATASTATLTFTTAAPTAGQTITITSTDGTARTYIAFSGAPDFALFQFDISAGTHTAAAASLKLAIEHADGHNGKITVVDSPAGTLTLTQATKGTSGDKALDASGLTNVAASGVSPATADTFTGGTNGNHRELKISDAGAENDYRVNSPVGDYGILKCVTWSDHVLDAACANSSTPNTVTYASPPTGKTPDLATISSAAGLIFYQAGVVILSPLVFTPFGLGTPGTGDSIYDFTATPHTTGLLPNRAYSIGANYDPIMYNSLTVDTVLETHSIDVAATALRKRINKIAFNNTTELNSTIYFCRANHNDFNYSSNPTYLKDSQIRVKENQSDAPVAYITSVGLYSSDNELLATAKLSEPLKKDPTTEMVLRVRLDY